MCRSMAKACRLASMMVFAGTMSAALAAQPWSGLLPPPAPEPVAIAELPLPPTAPSQATGACTAVVNPQRTGCMSASIFALQSGSFLPDGHEVLARVTFAGAPTAPAPSSIYTGSQIVIVKTDGTTFANGDPWKCLTCGVPPGNAVGRSRDLSYPQSFHDGKRVLAGTNVIDCSPYLLTDPRCTPKRIHIYPIRWNVTADGSGPGGKMRELRLHPDNMHLGFNSFAEKGGALGQFAYFARLKFDASPRTGAPLTARYDLAHVTRLFRPGPESQVLTLDPKHPGYLLFNKSAITVGELRGFTKDGREVMYIGYPFESSNIDVFAANLTTGKVRRLTRNPGYCDPVDSSPDDRWIVAMDTRASKRMWFMSGMRRVPPITDLLTTAAVASVRNNGARRFFEPFLIDRYGDRGSYQGQQLNAGDGSPGSASDPDWNGMADPRWSPDGTSVVYWQELVTRPACGGINPLPCPSSTEPGGRRSRMMIAWLTSRRPLSAPSPAPVPDSVPWGTPYVPGTPMPASPFIPAGTYILRGKVSGEARVRIMENPGRTGIDAVAVHYTNYSDDGVHIISGTESVSAKWVAPLTPSLDWHSDLVESGRVRATKRTSADGFRLTIGIMRSIFEAKGTLTTTVDGRVYRQPANGT